MAGGGVEWSDVGSFSGDDGEEMSNWMLGARIQYVVLCVAAMLGLFACTQSPKKATWQPETEIEKRLAQRVDQFYRYGQQHDHHAMYHMFASAFKQEETERQWLSVFEHEGDPVDEVSFFEIVSVEIVTPEELPSDSSDEHSQLEKAAFVEMALTCRRDDGESEISEARLDRWSWENGDWFYCGTY